MLKGVFEMNFIDRSIADVFCVDFVAIGSHTP